jgi:hypothetical protein
MASTSPISTPASKAKMATRTVTEKARKILTVITRYRLGLATEFVLSNLTRCRRLFPDKNHDYLAGPPKKGVAMALPE